MNNFMKRIRQIWVIALPMVIRGIVFQIQTLTDKAFLGNVDSKFISALGAAQFPLNTTVATVEALATGVIIISSRLYGAKEIKKIHPYVVSHAVYGTIFNGLLFAMWFFFTPQILSIFNVDSILFPYCVPYVKICAITLLIMAIEIPISSMLQGIGDTKPIMICGIVKVVCNIVISYPLIYGKFGLPRLEIVGAAVGTVVANLIAALGLIIYFVKIKKDEIMWDKGCLKKFGYSYYKEILKISVPTALEFFLWHASNLVLMAFLNGISYQATAIYTLTFGIEVIAYMVFNGTGKASMSLIGMDIGAKNYKSADGYIVVCAIVNTVLIGVCVALFAIFSRPILRIFTKESSLIEMSAPYLVVAGVIMFPKSMNVLIGNGIRAYKDAKWMLFTQIIGSICTVTLSYVLLTYFNLGVTAIYATLFCDESLRAIINFIHYRRHYSSGAKYRKEVA